MPRAPISSSLVTVSKACSKLGLGFWVRPIVWLQLKSHEGPLWGDWEHCWVTGPPSQQDQLHLTSWSGMASKLLSDVYRVQRWSRSARLAVVNGPGYKAGTERLWFSYCSAHQPETLHLSFVMIPLKNWSYCFLVPWLSFSQLWPDVFTGPFLKALNLMAYEVQNWVLEPPRIQQACWHLSAFFFCSFCICFLRSFKLHRKSCLPSCMTTYTYVSNNIFHVFAAFESQSTLCKVPDRMLLGSPLDRWRTLAFTCMLHNEGTEFYWDHRTTSYSRIPKLW